MPADARLDHLLSRMWARVGALGHPLVWRMVSLIRTDAPVRLSPGLGTAALHHDPDADDFRIEIDPEFLAAEIRDEHDLLFLLLHEIAHLVRDDHGLPSPTPRHHLINNIVTDVLNNAWLLGPDFAGVFNPRTCLAARRHLPCPNPVEGLLTPRAVALGVAPGPDAARAFFRQHVTPPAAPGRDAYEPEQWAAGWEHAIRAGQMFDAPTLQTIRQLTPLFDQLPEDQLQRVAAGCRPRAGQAAKDAARRRLGGSLCSGASAGAQAGSGGSVHEVPINPRHAGRRLLRALQLAFGESVESGLPVDDPAGPYLQPDDAGSRIARRALVDHAAGIRATPFAAADSRGGERPVRLPIYLDVSGSMQSELPVLLDSLLREGDGRFEEPLRAFSTRIEPLSRRDLRAGRISSTGGTDFNAVAADLLKRRTRHAVIVTDGRGDLTAALRAQLRQQRIQLAIVYPEEPRRSPWDEVVAPRGRIVIGLRNEFASRSHTGLS
ncbi:MAG: hypothetical protein AB7K09_07690 [Planctomycetota bacterium]